MNITLGLAAFVVDLGIARCLQAVLVVFKLLSVETLSENHNLFEFRSRTDVILMLLTLVGLRCLIAWGQNYYKELLVQDYKFKKAAEDSHSSLVDPTSTIGTAVNRIDNWIINAAHYLSVSQALIQVSSTLFALAFALMWSSLRLFLLAHLVLFAVFPLVRYLNRKIYKQGKEASLAWGRFLNQLSFAMRNVLFLKIHGILDDESRKVQSELTSYRDHALHAKRLISLSYPLAQLSGAVALCSLLIFGQDWAHLSKGALIAFFYLFNRYGSLIAQTSGFFSEVSSLSPNIILLYETEQPTQPAIVKTDEAKKTAEISRLSHVGWSLKDISFHYPNRSENVFEKLNLDVPPNSTLVVLGHSGVGKSTLWGLLLGQLKPTSGRIEVLAPPERIPLESIKDRLLVSCASMSAETYLIEGSIQKNLLFGVKDSPSEQEIEQALNLARCNFVYDLPNQLEYRLSEQGAGLSFGQKQRICIARALLRKPRVMLLDEATVHLDAELEKEIFQLLLELEGKMTLLIASHRPVPKFSNGQVLSLPLAIP